LGRIYRRRQTEPDMSRENAGSSAPAVTRNGRISLAPMSET
jgi:hypothetical protein